MIVGTNPEYVADYETAAPYRDLVRECRGWGRSAKAWEVDPTIPVDAAGWPTVDAATVTYARGRPAGDYVLSWSGPGVVTVSAVGQQLAQTDPVRGSDGVTRRTVHLDPPAWRAAGDDTLVTISVAGGATGVSLMHPADVGKSGALRDEYVASVAGYDTCRTVCLQRINYRDGTSPAWPEPPTPFRTGNLGVPVGDLIELWQRSGANGWACAPDGASDEWLAGFFGAIARSSLPASFTLRTETSNELWNFSFSQAARNVARAAANGALDATDPYSRATQQIAFDCWRVGAAARAAFAAAGRDPSRVRAVLCGQGANPWWTQSGLDWARRAGKMPDAVGLAPYLNLYDPKRLAAAVDRNSLFAGLVADTRDTNGPLAWMDNYAKLGLPVEAYEWGGGLLPWQRQGDPDKGAAYLALCIAAQDDPQWADLYRELAAHWQAVGGGLACHYALTGGWGTDGLWGLRQSASDPWTSVRAKVVAELRGAGEGVPVNPGASPTPTPTPVPVPVGPAPVSIPAMPSRADVDGARRVFEWWLRQVPSQD